MGVGYTNGSGFTDVRTLGVTYDGHACSISKTANPATGSNQDSLYGVTRAPGTSRFWAVGNQGPPRPGYVAENTLVEQCAC